MQLRQPFLDPNVEEFKEDLVEVQLFQPINYSAEPVIIEIISFQDKFKRSIAALKKMNLPQGDHSQQIIPANAVPDAANPYGYEIEDYLKFTEFLIKLETLVIEGYTKAEQDNEEITLNYLTVFNDKLDLAIPTLLDHSIELSRKLALVAELITLSKPSAELLEFVEPLVSPLVGLLGGVLGLLIGIPAGAIAGVAICLFALIKSGGIGSIPPSGDVLLVMFGMFAVIGACVGAFMGATEGAKELWALNHNTFFKPSEIQDLVKNSLFSKTFQNFLGKQIIEKEIFDKNQHPLAKQDNHSELPYVLIDIVGEYIDPKDKEGAFATNNANSRRLGFM